MKTDKKDIEIYNENMFYLKRRWFVKNIESIKLGINGAIIETVDGGILKKGDDVTLSNDKETITKNTSILCACVNLGKFFKQNSKLLYEMASKYYIFKNQENIEFIKWARLGEDLTKIPKISLQGEFRNIDKNKINNLDFENVTDLTINYDKEKLEKLLLKWFRCCGILDTDYNKCIYNHQLLDMSSLLVIFDSCLSVYNFYDDYCNGIIKNTLTLNVTYVLKQDTKGNLIVDKKVSDILSLAILSTITYCRNDYKILKECAYCHNLFFGRKNKLCCSQNCKDLKNRKYEKRKIKKSS